MHEEFKEAIKNLGDEKIIKIFIKANPNLREDWIDFLKENGTVVFYLFLIERIFSIRHEIKLMTDRTIGNVSMPLFSYTNKIDDLQKELNELCFARDSLINMSEDLNAILKME